MRLLSAPDELREAFDRIELIEANGDGVISFNGNLSADCGRRCAFVTALRLGKVLEGATLAIWDTEVWSSTEWNRGWLGLLRGLQLDDHDCGSWVIEFGDSEGEDAAALTEYAALHLWSWSIWNPVKEVYVRVNHDDQGLLLAHRSDSASVMGDIHRNFLCG